LFIIFSLVYWWCPESNFGIAIAYKAIIIHAISREPPSIYCQLDSPISLPDTPVSPSGEDDDDEEKVTELSIIPQDVGSLDAIYQALSECAVLHPDEEAEEDEEMFDGMYNTIYSPLIMLAYSFVSLWSCRSFIPRGTRRDETS
jgi:nucleotide-sensitive chloride channel 1A